MKFLKSRAGYSLLALVLLFAAVLGTWKYRAASQLPVEGHIIHSTGLADIDTGGQVPGDPRNAEEDFKKIYAVIQTYRNQHGGEYPKGAGQIISTLLVGKKFPNPEVGRKALKEAQSLIMNPDAKYSDNPVTRKFPDSSSDYNVINRRPDGTPVGAPPSGKKDVIASTGLYSHQNIRRFQGQRSTSNPVGFHIVLWHDGGIERIPYDKILYIPKGPRDYSIAYPNQAGVPANALTYDQYYQQMGWKLGPRGEVNGKGEAFDSKEPRRKQRGFNSTAFIRADIESALMNRFKFETGIEPVPNFCHSSPPQAVGHSGFFRKSN